jgi:hypothetical protein
MWYYQQGGPVEDDQSELSFDDDQQDTDQGPDQEETQNDDLSGKFDDLQDHYNDLQKKFSELSSKMNEDQNFQTLMGSFDTDESDENPPVPSDGNPINWMDVTAGVDAYKNHHATVMGSLAGAKTLGDSISARESGGSYTATNPHSTATGKYQFLWSQWGDSIKRATGVKSQQDFLHNPDAQERFYKIYEKTYLMPQVNKLKQQYHTGLSDDQLARLVHFRGAAGASKYLQGKLADKPESYNVPISQYIKQMGGMVARTRQQQNRGLNDSNYDEMYFPNGGYNTFRGLDNGQPVHLRDQRGKYVVLNGPHDTEKMYGNVYERKDSK